MKKQHKPDTDSDSQKKKRNLEILEEHLDLLDSIKKMVDAAVDKKLDEKLKSLREQKGPPSD